MDKKQHIAKTSKTKIIRKRYIPFDRKKISLIKSVYQDHQIMIQKIQSTTFLSFMAH